MAPPPPLFGFAQAEQSSAEGGPDAEDPPGVRGSPGRGESSTAHDEEATIRSLFGENDDSGTEEEKFTPLVAATLEKGREIDPSDSKDEATASAFTDAATHDPTVAP